MCLYPKLILNRKYMSNKKNGGVIPPINDERVLWVPIGCNNCIECQKQKARQWQVRLLEDIKVHKNGKFVTLTLSNESYKKLNDDIIKNCKSNEKPDGYLLDNLIVTRAIRLFVKRHVKKYKKTIRHWFISELGHNGTENIHLHGIIWTDENLDEIEKIWQYGFMWKGKEINKIRYNYVNEATVNYITKYVTKKDEKHSTYKPIILTSPGIGGNYTKKTDGDWNRNKFNNKETNETYRTRTGHKISLPIYWRNKIYSEEEREKLWLQKLDKEERWVMGEKISTSKDDTEYWKLVEWYRKINKKLGYGSDVKDYNKAEYERQQRILQQKTRIAKANNNNKKKAKSHNTNMDEVTTNTRREST